MIYITIADGDCGDAKSPVRQIRDVMNLLRDYKNCEKICTVKVKTFSSEKVKAFYLLSKVFEIEDEIKFIYNNKEVDDVIDILTFFKRGEFILEQIDVYLQTKAYWDSKGEEPPLNELIEDITCAPWNDEIFKKYDSLFIDI